MDDAPPARSVGPPVPALVAASVGLAALTAALLLLRHRVPAGGTALAATVALAVALARGRRARDRFAVRVADRAVDAAVLLPLAWAERAADRRVAAIALVGLGASYLASYERARGGALGYRGREPLPYLVARGGLLVLALLTGLLVGFLSAFAAVAVAAAGVRAWNVARQERPPASRPTPSSGPSAPPAWPS